MAGDRDIGDGTRNQIMQNLFGEQSEDEEEEYEVNQPDYHSEGEGEVDYEGGEGEGEVEEQGEAYMEGEGEGEVEEQGEAYMESEGEAEEMEPMESEGEKVHSFTDKEAGEQHMESENKDMENEDEYEQRVVTSRRREVIASESEGSGGDHYVDRDNEDEGFNQYSKQRSPEVQNNEEADDEAVRQVFGDSDDEEAEYDAQKDEEQYSHRSPVDEDGKDLRPEDIVPDKDMRYESEERQEHKIKDRPLGPPLELEIPFHPPPGRADRMNMIKVSNIMGIEPKPFNPKTYVEEDVYVTDESGTKKRIRLEDNIVRWRHVKGHDGTKSIESNARFVKWSDGSMQLLIGNEVLNLTVQEAHHDQTHLFLRHGKGILQSQGRILRKMRFMPSSLTSKSHRLLTALVDSRHKKVYKVKNCVTDFDPERQKEMKEKVEGQTIRASGVLHRKREKVKSKYAQTTFRREQQLSPGFLEDGPENEEDDDYYVPRRGSSRHHMEDDIEAEALAERRIIDAKRSNANKYVQQKKSTPASRSHKHSYESEREESEYETDGEGIERSPNNAYAGLPDDEEEYEDDEDEDAAISDKEEEEPRKRTASASGHKRKETESDKEDSPPRKAAKFHRRAVFDSSEED